MIRHFGIWFSTYHGKVTCATQWGQEQIEMKSVKPGLENSYEKFFHDVSHRIKHPNFLVIFKSIIKGENGESEKKSTATGALPELPNGKGWMDIPLSKSELFKENLKKFPVH
jgi:erythromycin esterase-like protein